MDEVPDSADVSAGFLENERVFDAKPFRPLSAGAVQPLNVLRFA